MFMRPYLKCTSYSATYLNFPNEVIIIPIGREKDSFAELLTNKQAVIVDKRRVVQRYGHKTVVSIDTVFIDRAKDTATVGIRDSSTGEICSIKVNPKDLVHRIN